MSKLSTDKMTKPFANFIKMISKLCEYNDSDSFVQNISYAMTIPVYYLHHLINNTFFSYIANCLVSKEEKTNFMFGLCPPETRHQFHVHFFDGPSNVIHTSKTDIGKHLGK